MKSTLTEISMPAMSLFFALAVPIHLTAQSPRYIVADLGPAGNPFSQALWLNNFGMMTGLMTEADGSQHAVVWLDSAIADIGNPGLGGPNSQGGAVNEFGMVLGQAETTVKDKNDENFCGYGTGLQCLPFLWQYGSPATPLATLGGTNGTFGGLNNVGEVVGIAETSTRDSACPGKVAVNGTGPQQLDFEAVIWGPKPGEIRQLSPLPGDTVSMALSINDYGEAVGISGTCANTVLPPFFGGMHAVFWERNGTPVDLGNLGGAIDTSFLGDGNAAAVINNRGMITGLSSLKGNTAFHPMLWTRETGIIDLGVLPGDLVGAGLGMNNSGEIVGASISAPGPSSGNPRAFLWQAGVMTDLNTLVQKNAPLYLLTAFAINDAGVIVGFGATSGGDLHGFVATPCEGILSPAACSTDTAAGEISNTRPSGVLSEKGRKQLLRLGVRGR